jgi:hypothetical protein
MGASASRSTMRRTLLLASAIAAGLLSLAAAASPIAVPDATGDVSIALRMEEVGGFAPFQVGLTRVPAFTLYQDGRVIYRSPDMSEDDPVPPLQQAALAADEADALLERALDEGGLRDARSEYSVDGVADATTTVFTVNGDGTEKTVSIYGLGFGDEGPDRDALRSFEALAADLSDPGAFLPEGTDAVAYEPHQYRGVFTEDDPAGPDLVPWPWDDLAPDDLQPVEDATAISQADLTPGEVALVTDVPNGGAFGIAIASPDGQAAWRLSIRPLLPDDASLTAEPAPSAAPTSPPPSSEDEYDYGY